MLPREFSNKVKKVLAQNELLFRQGAKEAAKYIAELQAEVRVAMVGAKGFELAHLKAIRAQIDRAGSDFAKKLTVSLHANQEAAFHLGSSAALQGFKAAGITLKLPLISNQLLTAAKDYSADLITNMTSDAIEEISAILRRGIITGENPYKTIKAVEENLFGDAEGLFARAEKIVRTENGRMYEVANQARLEQIAKDVPGMKKIWVAGDDDRTRESHRQAGMDYAPGGAIGPIPVDQPFIIGGVELMMPNDPDGEPHEVINCRCSSVPYMDSWEKDTENLQDGEE